MAWTDLEESAFCSTPITKELYLFNVYKRDQLNIIKIIIQNEPPDLVSGLAYG